jgi:hypothetical protein
MYHDLSRSLYRHLLTVLQEDGAKGDTPRSRQQLLDACETTLSRLATDREYFARPDRFLFTSVRCLYPIHAQGRVRRLIDRALPVAVAILDRRTAEVARPCAATTRCGTPCRRVPVRDSRYCPSHRHLEAELEAFEADAGAQREAVTA